MRYFHHAVWSNENRFPQVDLAYYEELTGSDTVVRAEPFSYVTASLLSILFCYKKEKHHICPLGTAFVFNYCRKAIYLNRYYYYQLFCTDALWLQSIMQMLSNDHSQTSNKFISKRKSSFYFRLTRIYYNISSCSLPQLSFTVGVFIFHWIA